MQNEPLPLRSISFWPGCQDNALGETIMFPTNGWANGISICKRMIVKPVPCTVYVDQIYKCSSWNYKIMRRKHLQIFVICIIFGCVRLWLLRYNTKIWRWTGHLQNENIFVCKVHHQKSEKVMYYMVEDIFKSPIW